MSATTGITLTGTTSNETLLGTSGDDTFYASAGNDRIWGGTGGFDRLVLSGALSDYSVKDNGDGSYTLTDLRPGGDGEDVVRAIDNFQFTDATVSMSDLLARTVNLMTGTAGADTLLGTGRNDRFEGGAGDDRIWGGSGGEDMAVYSGRASDYAIRDNGNGSYTITGKRGLDGVDVIRDIEQLKFSDKAISTTDFLATMPNVVTGTAGNDEQLGTAGNDRFLASGGDDRIWGGEGGDDLLVLTGRFEDYVIIDRLNGSYLVVDIRSGSPDGKDIVRDIGTFQFADRLATLGEFVAAHPNNFVHDGNGTAGNDVLIGTDGDDVLQGGGGKDRIWGGSGGDDTAVFTGAAADYEIVDNDNGAFTIIDLRAGSPDGISVVRDVEHFRFADATMDVVTAEDGSATLVTTLRGTAANDLMTGAHTSGLFDAHSNDLIIGNAGTDELRGGPGDDTLLGDSEEITYTHEFTSFPDTELPRFEYEPGLYQAINGQLVKLDPLTGQYAPIGPDNPNYNAAGLNPEDGYAYGVGTGGAIKGHLLRIGSDGNYESLGSGYPAVAAGGMSEDGKLYLMTSASQMTVIDIETLEKSVVSFGGAKPPAVHDIVFVPNDDAGTFYGVSVNGVLVAYDMTTMTVSTASIDGLLVGEGPYGAGWTSADGGLYFSHNSTGNIYGISGVENMEPSASLLSVGGTSSTNDGFSFGTATLPQELLGDGDDHLLGGAGNDTLRGQGGNDLLNGGEGADVLDGGTGFDTADYSHSTTAIELNLATGVHTGEAAGDVFLSIEQYVGSAFGDVMIAGGGNVHFDGRAGNDQLTGGAGADHLWGNDGDDVLAGGAGNDVLRGGLGADTFVFEAGGGSDIVRDFEAGIDLLDFTAFGAGFGAGSLLVAETGSGALLSWEYDGAAQQVLLEQVQVTSLPNDAFIFA